MMKWDLIKQGTQILTFVICAALFVGISKGCDLINAQDDGSNRTLVERGNDYLTESTFIAIDEASYQEMLNYLKVQNDDALSKMVVKGSIFVGDKGSRVTVIDYQFGKSLVLFVDTGQRGYVENEFIDKNLEE
jgi:hypothetical protein